MPFLWSLANSSGIKAHIRRFNTCAGVAMNQALIISSGSPVKILICLIILNHRECKQRAALYTRPENDHRTSYKRRTSERQLECGRIFMLMFSAGETGRMFSVSDWRVGGLFLVLNKGNRPDFYYQTEDRGNVFYMRGEAARIFIITLKKLGGFFFLPIWRQR